MAIQVKPGTVFKVINIPLWKIINVLFKAEFILGKEMVITSVADGTHSKDSLHYQNRAMDIRSKHLGAEEKQKLLQFLRENLGGDFDVILEDEGKPNEHIHIEYDPKETAWGSK